MGDVVEARGRPGYWFPLVLLGFGLLALLGWQSLPAGQDAGWFAYTPQPPGTGYAFPEDTAVSAFIVADLPPGLGWYPARDFSAVVLVTGILVATMAWYGRRARRAGGSARAYVVVAVGGGLAVPAGHVAAEIAGTTDEPWGLLTSVGLPLAGLGGLALAWAYLRLTAAWRAVVLVIGAGLLMIGVATMLGAWWPGLYLPVVVAGGLLALAGFERSRLLALVAVAVLVAMVVLPVGTLSLLLPAAIMLAAGVVTLARQVAYPVS